MIDIAILATTCLVNFILGVLILVRNPRLSSGRAFFCISLFICIWAISNFLTSTTGVSLSVNNISNKLAFLSAFLVIISGVWFSFNFPVARRLPGRPAFFVLLIIGATIIPLTLTSFISGKVTQNDGALHFSVGRLLVVYVTGLLLFVGIIIRNLLYVFLHNKDQERKQALYILVAFSIPVTFGVFTNAILPAITSSWQTARIGPLFTIILVGSIAYAMIYYGLFDIRFFVFRAAAYLTTLFAITFIFVTPIVLIFGYFLGFHPRFVELALVVFLSVCVLYLLQYLRRFFDKITGRLFLRHYYNPQDVLDKLSNILVRTADAKVLRNETTLILQEALKPTQLKYILFADQSKKDVELAKKINKHRIATEFNIIDADEIGSKGDGLAAILKSEDIALAARLRTTHEDLGYIVLGYRQSGERYTNRDKRLLGFATDEIAISLQNALRFEEIQRFNLTLQERVDKATRELRRTNQRLRELDETKDDFISMASHQLRTPLTSVKGYLSMVLEGDAGKLNGSQVKMLNQAFSSSQRMVYLITDLLNVSRLKTGKFIINTVPIDLSQLAEEEVSQLVETAEARHIELAYKKPASFPQLMLDETKTRQVIMNFIDNAIYYTPAGGHIQVELSDKPATVELKVVDDGIGVPRSEQHHLFTKFYRAANARKARPDGTGLGLFMAKKVIAAQSGSIVFSSKEGQGSTFGFIFSKNLLKAPHPTDTKSDAALQK